LSWADATPVINVGAADFSRAAGMLMENGLAD
jgi:hypothetical protein